MAREAGARGGGPHRPPRARRRAPGPGAARPTPASARRRPRAPSLPPGKGRSTPRSPPSPCRAPNCPGQRDPGSSTGHWVSPTHQAQRLPNWSELTPLGTSRPIQGTSHKSSNQTDHSASQCKLMLRGLRSFLEVTGPRREVSAVQPGSSAMKKLSHGPCTHSAGPGKSS